MPKFSVKQVTFVIIFCIFIIDESMQIAGKPSKETLHVPNKQHLAKNLCQKHALIKETRKNNEMLNDKIFQSPLKREIEKHRDGFGSGPNVAWEDAFPGQAPPSKSLSSKMYTSRKALSADSVYIRNCVFFSITESSPSPGGALLCSSSESTNLSIESTSFIICHSTEKGGAIFFYNGYFCLYKVCSSNCSTVSNSSGQFDYVTAKYSDTYINRVNETSITFSINYNNACDTMNHRFGTFVQLNMSRNNCAAVSGIRFFNHSNYKEVMLFSSFTNNTAHTGDMCLLFENFDYPFAIRECNIINNTQNDALHGIIHSYGRLHIINSYIFNNVSPRFIISSEQQGVFLHGCMVDDNFIMYDNIRVIHMDVSITSSIDDSLYKINDGCYVQLFDIIGYFKGKTCKCPKQKIDGIHLLD